MAMNEDLAQMLANLHLDRMAEILDSEVARARKGEVSYEEFLARLLRDQYHHGQEKALAARIQKAKIPEKWSLREINEFAELDFVPKAENIVFIGPAGVGKTGLATGILLKAIQNGYRGHFIRAQNLMEDLYASIVDHHSRKLIDHLSRFQVLVIDELGFLNLKSEQANIFFKLMEERYNHFPTIITTNLNYPSWGEFLGNQLLTEGLLSRLRHRCHTVQIEGPSLRVPQG
jgi:DNA replication protein DnaC